MSRKGSGKRAIVGFLIFIVAYLGTSAIYDMVKGNNELKKMEPLDTGYISDELAVINNEYVNFYLLKSDSGFIAIDCGDDMELTESALEELNINPEDVVSIFLTHSDADHIACIELFENAEVYLPEEEVPMVDGTAVRSGIFKKNSIDHEYTLIKDNEVVHMDGRDILCITTPGHTLGSSNYVVGEYLFVGDNISIQEGKAQLFQSFFNMSNDMQKESLEKITLLDGISTVFTGHHGYGSFETLFPGGKMSEEGVE